MGAAVPAFAAQTRSSEQTHDNMLECRAVEAAMSSIATHSIIEKP